MSIDEFIQKLESENRESARKHKLAKGLTHKEYKSWQAKHPGITLPEDLLALLRKANGIRINADEDSPEGIGQILPLKRIQHAAVEMYDEPSAEEVPSAWVAIAKDADESEFLIYDSAQGKYLEVDPVGPSEFEVVGKTLKEALTWIDEKYI